MANQVLNFSSCSSDSAISTEGEESISRTETSAESSKLSSGLQAKSVESGNQKGGKKRAPYQGLFHPSLLSCQTCPEPTGRYFLRARKYPMLHYFEDTDTSRAAVSSESGLGSGSSSFFTANASWFAQQPRNTAGDQREE